jgi:2'-5' RNA ligase
MHVTLFHFGGNAADLDPGLRDTLGRIVGQVAAQTAAPALEMSHVERFTPGDKGLEPATLVDDSPDVYALRQTLQDALDAENVPYSDDHAFRAHMTIGYYPPGAGPDAGPLDEPEMWTPDAIEVHWGPDVDRYPLAGAENMPGNMPATAAASPTAMKLQRLSQRVNKTDRALVHRLHATANLALSEALRAAHVKLKTRIRNRTRTKQAALEAAAAERITPAILAAVGVTENDLLGHRFDTYGATAIALIAAAERRKLAAIAAALGLDADQLEEQYGPTIDARAAVASGFLVGALGEFARAALSGTSLTSTGPGEYAGPVPFGLIRNAWDAAATGATPPTISQAGVSPADVDQLSESSALGQDTQTLVAEILADQDVRVQLRSTWVHGDPDRPFPPHEALDGLSWVDTQPPELDNPDSFPETDVYQPGDHDGCTCWIDVQYEPYEGDSGNTTGETDASTLANAE